VGLGSLSVIGLLNSQGDSPTSFRLNALKVILNMLLGTILIQIWGIPGLLVAVFISTVAGNALNHYVTQRKYGIDIDIIFALRVVIFSAIAGILTWQTLRITPFFGSLLQIIIGGAFFVSACLILAPISKAIGINDVQTLRKVMSKVPLLHQIAEPFLTIEEKIIRALNR
jgi:peptidoglycan biosynthesis protein MviN/MurJ (putative lipid II flippase)